MVFVARRRVKTTKLDIVRYATSQFLERGYSPSSLKQIAQFCEEIKLAARNYDPSHINRCLQELAACFHRFYNACRIKGEDAAVANARLKLADSVRSVLRNGMELIGCSAPERM